MRHELRTEIEAEMTEATKEISSLTATILFNKHVDETFGGIIIYGSYFHASYVLYNQDWNTWSEMRGRWLAVNGYEVRLPSLSDDLEDDF